MVHERFIVVAYLQSVGSSHAKSLLVKVVQLLSQQVGHWNKEQPCDQQVQDAHRLVDYSVINVTARVRLHLRGVVAIYGLI